ncbi:uroporphyrinogen-III synthase [Rhodoplanes sp. TEM]|uniref:Uroporphyrinogen-III synthase n=1 Tax=Rhodoplanes tepidamans TaxID=200616 RepID=A0ABT5J3G0_RHOTP|nr:MULTISPECIES: uroporphyrinogen-III synthase [Rhodoplanes]MDC7784198.1 uroporphyrinogen-III synthase [Rhodoplanes tepidamans]MDC7988139.1 uroporphyrinogen-III synthase [Rhodoplanes sp. TEM]MDQ0356704.1 uroporphyrinogen-III synthase [Rhodoplanes tepidamans]
MRLLVTRPDPDGARTADALRARGHDVLAAPLLRIEPVADAAIGDGPWAAVAVTSTNAIGAIVSHPQLSAAPVFTVGGRTAKAARAAGLADVRSADGDVHALAELIAAAVQGTADPVLYLAGEDRAGDLEALLAGRGLAVRTVVVYRAVAQTRLPDAVRAALASGGIDAVLHYSRRSAEAFLAACAVDSLQVAARAIRHLCLSPQVAAALREGGAQDVVAASRPDEANLFGLL